MAVTFLLFFSDVLFYCAFLMLTSLSLAALPLKSSALHNFSGTDLFAGHSLIDSGENAADKKKRRPQSGRRLIQLMTGRISRV
jgi:hypothetical protein